MEPAGSDETNASVLIAEDDPSVRRLISNLLQRERFAVVEAANARRALELARERLPDLAIIDVELPDQSGFNVVRSVKEQDPAIPVLVISGSYDVESRVRAFDAGADDFVAKPFDMRELLKRVRAFQRTRRAMEDLRRAHARTEHLRVFAAEAAALLAHDLNNGLTIALPMLDVLEDELNSPRPSNGRKLEAIAQSRQALRRMVGLVRNFVDISRLEDAALIPKPTLTRVDTLLRDAAQIHEARPGSPRATLIVSCREGLTANIDPVLVERVIHNLLNNSTRYVNERGTISIHAQMESDRLRIVVGNSGPPIPAERRAGLFEKYSTAGDAKGRFGMGLYFCRLACEAHGGAIMLADRTDGAYFNLEIRAFP